MTKMAERKKLEITELNQPVTVQLLFDSPLKGESKYGSYFAYAVNYNGEEMTFFSPCDEVNQKLINLKRGTKVQITKTARQNGKGIKVDFDVIVLEDNKPIEPELINKPAAQDDLYYSFMDKSFEDALRIQNKYNGANLNQIAVTIYISRLKQNNSFTGG